MTQFERWSRTFLPLKNHIDDSRGFEGCLYETFGQEVQHVQDICKVAPLCIWTVIEGDTGKWYVTQGMRFVNRVGYLITEREYDANNPVHVKRYETKDVFYM